MWHDQPNKEKPPLDQRSSEGLNGGHDWDRTSDPYDVNVVLSR